MSSPPPSRRLLAASSSPSARHRGPAVLALLLAALLLATALFVESAIARAAHLAVRGQVDAVSESLRRDLVMLGREPSMADLGRLLADHTGEGVRYVAKLRNGAPTAVAGDALGTGIDPGLPVRVGDRVRVVMPPGPDGGVIVYELVPVAANDIFMAGRIVLFVVGGADVLLIALGVLYARSLRARAELGARLEADRRLAALGEMSAVLSHELKNPLTSLKGNAQLLGESLPEGSPAAKKADRVVREIVRLERLTNDLLELVRTGELRTRRLHPRDVVAAAIEVVSPARIDALYAANVPELDLDPERLRVALENLLRNAVQASNGEPIDVFLEASGAMVTIVVRDRGSGIRPGEELSIFQPFQTGKAHGSGLGLAIARKIVELHRGTIEASNHVEGGAVFRVALPMPVAPPR